MGYGNRGQMHTDARPMPRKKALARVMRRAALAVVAGRLFKRDTVGVPQNAFAPAILAPLVLCEDTFVRDNDVGGLVSKSGFVLTSRGAIDARGEGEESASGISESFAYPGRVHPEMVTVAVDENGAFIDGADVGTAPAWLPFTESSAFKVAIDELIALTKGAGRNKRNTFEYVAVIKSGVGTVGTPLYIRGITHE